jgi:hypothetical protein
MEFDNTETIKRAVEINAGVAILPRPTVDREVVAGTLVARTIADAELHRPVGIIQRRNKVLGKTARRFMQLLQAEERAGQDSPLDESAFDDVVDFGDDGEASENGAKRPAAVVGEAAK